MADGFVNREPQIRRVQHEVVAAGRHAKRLLVVVNAVARALRAHDEGQEQERERIRSTLYRTDASARGSVLPSWRAR